ncbi:sulfotransferase [Haematococcus lacustris]|uniref:Sulfotransferase n=1 Tax=Haematococcus lacustris TaxID=44745 RepID=A0A699YCV5_HAELA|nr:sulfotransferase [Haematococcus lacustris]
MMPYFRKPSPSERCSLKTSTGDDPDTPRFFSDTDSDMSAPTKPATRLNYMKQQVGGRVQPRSLSRKAVLLVLAILAVAAGAFLLKTATGLINDWLQSHPTAASNNLQPQVKALCAAAKYIAAKALDPEAVSHALPDASSFNASFKNPCWNSPEIPHLKCLPYFYLMGSFQAGAGTLYQKNDKARWQFWAEDTKSMEGYVQEHSSGKTLAAVLHDPANKCCWAVWSVEPTTTLLPDLHHQPSPQYVQTCAMEESPDPHCPPYCSPAPHLCRLCTLPRSSWMAPPPPLPSTGQRA